MKVLVACECSQVVLKEFLLLGHDAFSCDVVAARGEYPDRHIQDDVLNHLFGWDLIIAHPPCTYLSNAGACRLYKNHILNEDRYNLGLIAKDFFIKLLNAPCNRICIENPVPSKVYNLPAPTQIIQPYMFGEPFSKKTLLWLKNLPPLFPTMWIDNYSPWVTSSTQKGYSRKGGDKYIRSKTFEGIAKAMALQWGNNDI